jgi:hypothetical protein
VIGIVFSIVLVTVQMGLFVSFGGLHPWNLMEGSLAGGIKGLGAGAEIRDQKVEVTTVTKGIRAFTTTPYVFTSLTPHDAGFFRPRGLTA